MLVGWECVLGQGTDDSAAQRAAFFIVGGCFGGGDDLQAEARRGESRQRLISGLSVRMRI